MMTNSDAEQLKRFLQAENTYEGKILCSKCRKRQCQDCSLLNKKYSEEEKDVFQRMWNNIVLIKDSNGAFRVKVNYLYKSNPHVIFSPENTNYNQALMMTKRVIMQLKKKGQLEIFQKEIEKKIEIGTLVAMSDAEIHTSFHTFGNDDVRDKQFN